jgi:hypothetical protein
VDKYKERYLSDSCPYRQKNIRAETLNDILKEKSQAIRQRKGKVVRPVTEEEYERLTTKTIFESAKKLVVQLTNRSDGTGESDVVKVDKSTFVGLGGTEPSKLTVEKIMYDVSSMRVTLTWDQTTDEVIAVLQGDGCLDWHKRGKHGRNVGVETGGTGDILLTTANQSSGDGYSITLYLCKKD